MKKASIISGTISVAVPIHARLTNDHCFGSKFGSNRLGLPPFSRKSAKKYMLNSQLATSETENETGAEKQAAVGSGNAPVSCWSIFLLSLLTIPEVFAKVNSNQFPSRPKVANERSPFEQWDPPTPLPSPTKNTTSFPGFSPTRPYGGRTWERRCQKHWVCKQTIQPKNPVSVSNATNISREKISKLWV